MLKIRVLPSLLLRGTGLVKTVCFKDETYIGDPINAVRIFNTKQVDELVLLDITATREGHKPNYDLIARISDECRMPLTVGGGIRTLQDTKELIGYGVEKVVINSYAVENPDFITEVADSFGSQSVVISIDVKRHFTGRYEVFTHSGRRPTKLDPVSWAQQAEQKGAGEILLTSIDREGTMKGYDTHLIKSVSEAVNVPIIANGGAASVDDFRKAVQEGGASAVTAGSMFVFHGKRRAVLINFPTQDELQKIFEGL